MTPRFTDRRSAGRLLAEKLAHLRGAPGVVVLGLPRGGLPVADEIARALDAPLDVVLVRKIGLPANPELALGAVAGPEGKTLFVNRELVEFSGLDAEGIEALAAPRRADICRRRALWGGRLQSGALAGKSVILVDDGIATGATMRAAIRAVRDDHPESVIVATPVAPRDTLASLSDVADDVVCLAAPENFVAVGTHYRAFPQISDGEVRDILDAANGTRHQTTSDIGTRSDRGPA